MGHHIDAQGRFQSDRHPDLAPDKIIVSFKHPEARAALRALADGYSAADPELANDIMCRLRSIQGGAMNDLPIEPGRPGTPGWEDNTALDRKLVKALPDASSPWIQDNE